MNPVAGAALAYLLVAVLLFGYTFLTMPKPSLMSRVTFCLMWMVLLPLLALARSEDGES